MVESDNPIALGSISPSQADARVPSGLPGGDPSFMIIPPVEQFRSSYVFLTPDKYIFDFIRYVCMVDGSRAENELGFRARATLRETIRAVDDPD
jgi:hypothetical protein